VADHDPTERRREDRLHAEIAHALGEEPAAQFGLPRMLQHERALKIARAVQAGGQTKMALEEGAHPAKKVDNGCRGRGGHRNITRAM
jgi:hypothetical protein